MKTLAFIMYALGIILNLPSAVRGSLINMFAVGFISGFMIADIVNHFLR